MTDVRSMSYAAIVIAVIDGELTAEAADSELKRRATHSPLASTRAARTHLAATSQDDDE